MQDEKVKKPNRTRIIIILVVVAVVVGGLIFVATKASDFTAPSHGDFKKMHSQ